MAGFENGEEGSCLGSGKGVEIKKVQAKLHLTTGNYLILKYLKNNLRIGCNQARHIKL